MEKLRQCIVHDQLCYFHGWYTQSEFLPPSPMPEKYSGGVVSHVYGLIEDRYGTISLVSPFEIKFNDETTHNLYLINEHYMAHKLKES